MGGFVEWGKGVKENEETSTGVPCCFSEDTNTGCSAALTEETNTGVLCCFN